MRFTLISTIATLLLFSACKELVKYSFIPEIKNEGYKIKEVNDSENQHYELVLKFSLIDGNGDVGHQEGEGLPSEKDSSVIIPPTSIYMKRYSKVDGEYISSELNSNILNKSLLFLQPKGQNKTLIADIEIAMTLFPSLIVDSDTLRFEYYLVDREGNESNVLFSADIPFKEPTYGYVKGKN